jgi:hypothetical protein
VDLQLGANIYSVVGCTGRENKEKEREGYAVECTDRTVYFHKFDQ